MSIPFDSKLYKALDAVDSAFTERGVELFGNDWADARYSSSFADKRLELLATAYYAMTRAYNQACLETGVKKVPS